MPADDPETAQLLVLAVDHRVDLCREILESEAEQPTAEERERAAALAHLPFEGLTLAIEGGVAKSSAVIWVDADLGEAVLLRARAMALATAVSVDRPGLETLQLEGGAGCVDRLRRFGASYAAARVPHRSGITREEQKARLSALRLLSETCRIEGPPLLLELVVLPAEDDLQRAGGVAEWNEKIRPLRTVEAMRELQDGGVEPAVWVVEATTDPRAAATIAGQAHMDDRMGVRVLFAVGNEPTVEYDGIGLTAQERSAVQTAARTIGVSGLLAGPAAYFRQLARHNSGERDRADTVADIASRLRA
ncbi:MAG: DUF2090 domain-containing protein, partial [Gemmatimonadetes bacterium]|nr:DUF2090 domain-containing protein [Gemmatimonadota bacterium]